MGEYMCRKKVKPKFVLAFFFKCHKHVWMDVYTHTYTYNKK